MNIFIVRHAESYSNTQGMILSTTDLDLTEKGVRQAEALHKRISQLTDTYKLDCVFSSPLIRAAKTASIASKAKDIVTTKLLGEMDLGVLEGLSWHERASLYPDIDMDRGLSRVYCREGESYLAVEERCTEFVRHFLHRMDEDANVLIATHGITMRVLTNVLLDKPREHVNYLNWAENTALTHIVFDKVKNCGKAVFINDTGHLYSKELRNEEYETWGLFSKKDYLTLES